MLQRCVIANEDSAFTVPMKDMAGLNLNHLDFCSGIGSSARNTFTARPLAKSPFVLLALGLLIFASSPSLAQDDDLGSLNQRIYKLVTLSACDTGSGQARAGEGVMGLRRGFIQAGAQNLLMTLWPISDEVTVQIMSDFYEAAHKSGNAPEALAEVQRKWLLQLRAEKGLAQAVNLAGPFIISSQGKP
jgi:hypothetical protein